MYTNETTFSGFAVCAKYFHSCTNGKNSMYIEAMFNKNSKNINLEM